MNKPQDLSRRAMLARAGTFGGAYLAQMLSPSFTFAAWPTDKAIRIIVPNPPGGSTDIMARLIGPPIAEALGTSVYVENKGGGGGNIGIAAAAKSEPDGYTVLVATSVFMINPSHIENSAYDPYTDFAPISLMTTVPNCMIVDAKLGVSSVPELIEFIRKNPGKYNYTTSGLSTTLHIAATMFKKNLALDWAYVPYGGSGPSMQALLSNAVQVMYGSLATALPSIQAGNVKAIAILGPRRWPTLPDVPTWRELRLPEPDYDTLLSMLAPAKTPPEIVNRLATAVNSYLARPETRTSMLDIGIDVIAGGPDVLRDRIKIEVPLWKRISDEVGVKAKK